MRRCVMKTNENWKNIANWIQIKMDLKFQNPSLNILSKIAFWNKQSLLNKELITWSGSPK